MRITAYCAAGLARRVIYRRGTDPGVHWCRTGSVDDGTSAYARGRTKFTSPSGRVAGRLGALCVPNHGTYIRGRTYR